MMMTFRFIHQVIKKGTFLLRSPPPPPPPKPPTTTIVALIIFLWGTNSNHHPMDIDLMGRSLDLILLLLLLLHHLIIIVEECLLPCFRQMVLTSCVFHIMKMIMTDNKYLLVFIIIYPQCHHHQQEAINIHITTMAYSRIISRHILLERKPTIGMEVGFPVHLVLMEEIMKITFTIIIVDTALGVEMMSVTTPMIIIMNESLIHILHPLESLNHNKKEDHITLLLITIPTVKEEVLIIIVCHSPLLYLMLADI
jgi:hypothetical protein